MDEVEDSVSICDGDGMVESESDAAPKKRGGAGEKPAAAARGKAGGKSHGESGKAATTAVASLPAAAAAKPPRSGAQRAAGVVAAAADAADAAAAGACTAAAPGGTGGQALASDVARFADREADRFPFLSPARIRDAKGATLRACCARDTHSGRLPCANDAPSACAGRRPDDAHYDPSTLQLPKDFPKARAAQRSRSAAPHVRCEHLACALMCLCAALRAVCAQVRTASGEAVTISGGQEQWWRFKASAFACTSLHFALHLGRKL